MPNFIATVVANYAAGTAGLTIGTAVTATAVNTTFVMAYTATFVATTALVASGVNSYVKKKMSAESVAGTSQRMTFESSFPRRKIYGDTVISGNVCFADSSGTDNSFMDLVIVVGEGEIDSFTAVKVGDHVVQIDSGAEGALRRPQNGSKYRDNIEFYFHHGAQNQGHNTTLATRQPNKWTSNHRLRGIAYVYVRLIYDKDLFSQGIPNLRFFVKGSKVYDPRKDTANGYSGSGAHSATNSATWEHSTNPILALRDFVTLPKGLNAQASDLNEARFIEMANSCDDDISLHASNGTTQKRFAVNGPVDLSAAKAEVAEAILSSCNGSLVWSQGKYTPQVGVAVPNSRNHTLNADNLRGGISFTTRAAKSQRINSSRGTFVDASANYQATDFSPIRNTTYRTEDGEELFGNLSLPLTTDNTQAQRLAKQVLEANRQAIEVDFPANLSCFHIQPNDTVQLSIDPDGSGSNTAIFSNKKFQVIEWKFSPNGGVDLKLREYSDTVYDWAYGELTTRDLAPNTSLPDPSVVATVGTPNLTFDSAISSDGSFNPAMTVSWTAPANTTFIVNYLIEVQRRAETSDTFTTISSQTVPKSLTSHTFLSVLSGQQYRARITGVNSMGVEGTPSSFSSASFAVDGTAPSAPTNVTVTSGYNQLTVNWTNATQKDLDRVSIFSHPSNNSSAATLIGTASGTSFIHTGMAASVQKYYWLKSADYTGNLSAFSSSANGTTDSQNPTGPQGIAGLNTATAFLYKKNSSSSSIAGAFSGNFTYTFGNSSPISGGTLNGWTQTPPTIAAGEYLWVRTAVASANTATDTIASSEFSTAQILSIAGSDGVNSSPVFLYKKNTSSSSITGAFSGTFTYTFSSNALSNGTLNGWTTAPPSIAAGEYLWFRTAIASSNTATATIVHSAFSAASILSIGGEVGPQGIAGINTAQVNLYKVSSSSSSHGTSPTGTKTYTFSTGVLSNLPSNSWVQSAPTVAQDEYLWIKQAVAASNTATDDILVGEWSQGKVIAFGGSTGAAGVNSAPIFMYKSNSSASSSGTLFSGNFTWNFTNKTLGTSAVTLNSWSNTLPTLSDGEYLWMTQALASSNSSSVTFSHTAFSTPKVMSYVGEDGLNTATVNLYKKTSNSSYGTVPSGNGTYTFSTGALTGTGLGSGAGAWSQNPSSSLNAGDNLWLSQAFASANASTDTIAANEWSTPKIVGIGGVEGPHGAGIFTLAAVGTPPAFPTGNAAQISAAVNVIFQASAGVGNANLSDKAILYLGTLASQTSQKVYIYNGTLWEEVTQYVDGHLVVNGTVDATKLSATNLSSIFVDAGTITAGILQNSDASFKIDLTNGTITISV